MSAEPPTLKSIASSTVEMAQEARYIREEDKYRSLSPDNALGFRLPIVYSDNEVFFSKAAAFAPFEIPQKPWGVFLSTKQRESYQAQTTRFYERVFPAGKTNSGHLIVTNTTYSARQWLADIIRKQTTLYEKHLKPRGVNLDVTKYEKYSEYAARAVNLHEFTEKQVYLFAKTGLREDIANGVLGSVQKGLNFFANMLFGMSAADSQPTPDELKFWHEQSETVSGAFQSWPNGVPLNRRGLEWVVRHLETPGLPTVETAPSERDSWGAGEWRNVLSASTKRVPIGVYEKQRLEGVQITSPYGVTYSAFLPVAIIPNELTYQVNWQQHAETLPFPVGVSTHFEVIDPERALDELKHPMRSVEVQQQEDAEAGSSTDDTILHQQEGLREVKQQARINRKPMVYWQTVFSVTDTTPEGLLGRVVQLIRHYKDIDFELVCPNLDQRELYYQQFPGSTVLVDDWIHRTNCEYLAMGQPWLTTAIGDLGEVNDSGDVAIGLYQGNSVTLDQSGAPREGRPFFYDLMNVADVHGKAPVETVCAFPGAGKTVSRGLKVAHEDALRGFTQFIWDPKGDFVPLKTYAKALLLDSDMVRLVDLDNPDTSVSLDPFLIAEVDDEMPHRVDEREQAASETIMSLCYDLIDDGSDQARQVRRVINRAVAQVIENEKRPDAPVPTMEATVALLASWSTGALTGVDLKSDRNREQWIDASTDVIDRLAKAKRDRLGRFLFKNDAGTMKAIPGTLTIFNAAQMPTTEPNMRKTLRTAIGDIIAGLMTDYIRSLVLSLPDDLPKAAFFDEWHVIRRTGRAEALVDWCRRMGRSKRTKVTQLSQYATDFSKGSIASVWCGYVEDEENAIASCDLLGIEASEDNIAMLMHLKAGQFVFRDVLGRVQRVSVDFWDSKLLEYFNTKADTKTADRLEKLAASAGNVPPLSAPKPLPVQEPAVDEGLQSGGGQLPPSASAGQGASTIDDGWDDLGLPQL